MVVLPLTPSPHTPTLPSPFEGSQRISRLASLLESGVVVHTDCSGKCSPEACFELLDVALLDIGVALPDGWLVLWRACDAAKLCQRVSSNMAHRPFHIFDGLIGKLPMKHQKELHSRRPDPKASAEDRSEGYAQMDAYLDANAKQIYSTNAVAGICILHPGSQCKLRWQDPEGVDELRRPLTIGLQVRRAVPFPSSGSARLSHTLTWRLCICSGTNRRVRTSTCSSRRTWSMWTRNF